MFSAKHGPDNSVKQRRGGKNVPIFANTNMYTQKYKYIYKYNADTNMYTRKYKYIYKYDANTDMILQVWSYFKKSSKMEETGFPLSNDLLFFYANGQKPERV